MPKLRFLMKSEMFYPAGSYGSPLRQKQSIEMELEVGKPLGRRSDAVEIFLRQQPSVLRDSLKEWCLWSGLVDLKDEGEVEVFFCEEWERKLKHAEVFCDGKLLDFDSDLVGSKVDDLVVLRKGHLVSKDRGMPYIAVQLSDKTHRVLRWDVEGFKVFDFWKGFSGVSGTEYISLAMELIRNSKRLPHLEWSTEDYLSLLIHVSVSDDNFIISCTHTSDGLDDCILFIQKLVPVI